MTGDLWNALKAHFHEYGACREHCKEVFRGYDGEREKSALPYVVVDFINGGTEDTFGSDGESCDVVFTIHTKREAPNAADLAFDAILRAFDNASFFTDQIGVDQMNRTEWTGPMMTDASLKSTLTYRCEFQRSSMVPVVRET